MADKAFDWAASKKLLRDNEIHGEQEARLVLEDSFAFKEREGERAEETSSIRVNVPWQSQTVDTCSLKRLFAFLLGSRWGLLR